MTTGSVTTLGARTMAEPERAFARPGLILAAMLVACVQVSATGSAVTAALPAIGRSLHATQTQLSLIADVYVVMLGGLVLAGGALLDRYGRKTGMLCGLVVMAGCCLWSALATSPTELLISRCATGVGSAALFPGTLATITSALPPRHHDRNVALWAGCVFAGGGIGLVMAGVVIQLATWQTVFVLLTCGALIIAVLILLVVPETREPENAHLDPVGALLGFIGLSGPVLAIIELPTRGLDSLTVSALIIGLLALVAFVGWELHSQRPLIDLRVFGNRAFVSGAAGVGLSFAIAFGWLFLSFQYFQYVRGDSSLLAACLLIPVVITSVVSSVSAATLSARLSRRTVIVSGLLIQAVSLAIMAVGGGREGVFWVLVGFAVFGIGTGLVQAPASSAIVAALPRAKQGVASAVNDASRELGAARASR